MKKSKIRELIRQAFDLHVHIGPELIPRKYTVEKLVTAEEGKIKGFALKNHFFSTVPFIAERPESTIQLVGSIVLNNFVGGINPDAVYAASTLSRKPFIVWFPTVSAKQFLINSEWEIAPEWIENKNIICRKSEQVMGISIVDSKGYLTEETICVLQAIRNTSAILATGHISWQESVALVKEAARIGISKIIVTHPVYQKISMPLEIQKELISYGAIIEQCYSMYSIDKIAIEKIAQEIRILEAENCILSSDVGQSFSPSPSEALLKFSLLLHDMGISLQELDLLLVKNPAKLVLS